MTDKEIAELREWADIYNKSLSVLATDIVMGYIRRMGGYENIMRAMSDVAYSSTEEADNRQEKLTPYGAIDCTKCKDRWCEELEAEK
jgi:hypothetical protein